MSAGLVSVDRPVGTVMVVAAVALFGLVSLQLLPVNLMPEIDNPTITVEIEYEGAAPEEVEEEVTEPVEGLVRTVEGVIGVSSVSRAGRAEVMLDLEWGADLDYAAQKVRERVSLIPFPDGVGRPSVLRYDPTLDPVLRLAVFGNAGDDALRRFAVDELKRALDPLPGVAMVRVLGGIEEAVRVEVDSALLRARGLSIGDIAARLEAENLNVAGGTITDGDTELIVRTLNQLSDVDAIASLAVGGTAFAPVRLSDVATVDVSPRRQRVATRFDGVPSVEIEVFREADANPVDVSQVVRAAVFDGSDQSEGVAAKAPPGVQIELLNDQSRYIESAVTEVTSTAILGGLFAVLVLFVSLRRAWPTFVIALAIPLSVVATFAPMRWMGLSLNIMSLGGMALGVGMLVDNAIVVLESIVRRIESGESRRDAAIAGTREVAGAVVASTMTTIAVFLPIAFVPGVAGQLFGDLALVVVLSLIASLIFAIFFVPMMLALPVGTVQASDHHRTGDERRGFASSALFFNDLRWLRSGLQRGASRRVLMVLAAPFVLVWILLRTACLLPFDLFFNGVVARLADTARRVVGFVARLLSRERSVQEGVFTRVYRRVVRGALRARFVVAALAIAVLVGSGALWTQLGLELIPEMHQGEIIAQLEMPVGTPLEETAEMAAAAELALRGIADIEALSTRIGSSEDRLQEARTGENVAEIRLRLVPAANRAVQEARVAAEVREALAAIAGVRLELSRPELFHIPTDIEVTITGYDLRDLAETAAVCADALREMPLLDDVRSNQESGFPEVQVRLDRNRLAAMGLTARAVADVIRDQVHGRTPTVLRERGRTLDVDVRLDQSAARTLEDLRTMEVAAVATGATPGATPPSSMAGTSLVAGGIDVAAGGRPTTPVLLGSVADILLDTGPAEIRRVNGRRAAVVSSSATIRNVGAAATQAQQVVDGLSLRPEQSAWVGGQSTEMQGAATALLLALLFAVFLVYAVMASTFESFMGPFVILLSIPLAFTGVVLWLAATDTPVSVIVLIGTIVLAGIVVNNAIVLVDAIIQRRRAGRELDDAIVEACASRLRPVLITATTTVLGLMPMALRMGDGAEIRRPLAGVVMAGLSSSTVLTLVVIPVVYRLIGELGGLRGGVDPVSPELADADVDSPA